MLLSVVRKNGYKAAISLKALLSRLQSLGLLLLDVATIT